MIAPLFMGGGVGGNRGLRFQEVGGGTADIDIEFAHGLHSDGPGNEFDGKGKLHIHVE